MASEGRGEPDLLAALENVADELRSFRQHFDTVWQGSRDRAEDRQKANEESYADYERQCSEAQLQHEERQRIYEERQRKHEVRWKLTWIVNAWYLFVSIMFIIWLAQQ